MSTQFKNVDHKLFKDLGSIVPYYDSFFTVSEHKNRDKKLADECEHVSFDVLGQSTDKNDIWSISIGGGKYTAFLFAAPHPNEPIGSMTIDFLIHQLAKDDDLRESLDYEFIFIKTADIDGTVLNQGWFDGPFTISNYAQNFYRPASYEQVEWTFPLEYKNYKFDSPMPETEILMSVIAEHKPDVIYSLHNAGFGGCYYYISHNISPIFDDLRQVSRDTGVPLDLGEPESPWMNEFGDAVFQMPSAIEQYDYYEQETQQDPTEVINSGAGSFDFAKKHNSDVVEIATELPYFYDPQIQSDELTEQSRKEIIIEGADQEEQIVSFVTTQYERVADNLPASRIKESVDEVTKKFLDRIDAKREWAQSNSELDTKATVAQTTDATTIRPFYRILYMGTFMRLLDHAAMNKDSSNNDRIESVKSTVESRFHELIGQLLNDLDYTAIPIHDLVTIQSRAGLIVLDYLQKSEHLE